MGEERDTMKKLNVLSLFDGISAGMVALKRAGIPMVISGMINHKRL